MGDDWLGQHGHDALGEPGFDGLVFGEAGEALARSGPSERILLARCEQFAGRERAADERLREVILDPRSGPEAVREARSQQRLGAVFDPALAMEDFDWFQTKPPEDLDATGLRECVAIAWGRLMTDGRDPLAPRPDDFEAPDWAELGQLITLIHATVLSRLALAKLPEILRLFDIAIWTALLLLTQSDSRRSLEVLAAARRAQSRYRIRMPEHFLDYATGIASFVAIDLEAATPMLARGVDGFARCRERSWWMQGKAAQALVASLTRAPMPAGMDELERTLISGSWRNDRPSRGHTTLMFLSLAFAARGDLEAARRMALAGGELDDLVVVSTDRAILLEMIFNSALAEGDTATCERMMAKAGRLMGSPTVLTIRERMEAAMKAYREGILPDPPAEPEADPSHEALRTRWMILAQTVAYGSRGEAWSALADFDAFTGRTAAAALRRRAIELLHGRTVVQDAEALSPRQLEVATLAGAGLSNTEIANELFLSLRTVEDYLGQALKRLGLQHRIELASVELPLEFRDQGRRGAPLRLPLRQGQVGALVSAGASNAEIAEVLAISQKTLDVHISALKKKLGASTRTELAARFAA